MAVGDCDTCLAAASLAVNDLPARICSRSGKSVVEAREELPASEETLAHVRDQHEAFQESRCRGRLALRLFKEIERVEQVIQSLNPLLIPGYFGEDSLFPSLPLFFHPFFAPPLQKDGRVERAGSLDI